MGEAAETVPQTSAVAEEEYRTSSVSYSFRLEWKIPTKAFTDSQHHTPRPTTEGLPLDVYRGRKVIENSKQFEFKNLKIHPFCLVLLEETGYYLLTLVTKEPTDGVKLDYAFVWLDERLLSLQLFYKSPLTYMKTGKMLSRNDLNRLKQKDVKIICGISAVSNVSNSTGDQERFIMECSLPLDLPPSYRESWPTRSSSTAREALTDYSLSGQLPSLNVELAIDLLGASSDEKNVELKALCVEYLMENLSAENVVGVLHAACDHHAKVLVERCKNFITKYCRVVPR